MVLQTTIVSGKYYSYGSVLLTAHPWLNQLYDNIIYVRCLKVVKWLRVGFID